MDVRETLRQAVEMGASDIFIIAGLPLTYKVDGRQRRMEARLMPADTAAVISDIYTLCGRSRSRIEREDMDDDFSFSIPDLGRFRANVLHQRGSLAAVIRVIRFGLPEPEKLNIPPEVLASARLMKGLVLVTGSAGSGKSTTLACLINAINQTREGHIITMEDPIEYIHRHDRCIVTQREISTDSPSYVSALRSALRESKDDLCQVLYQDSDGKEIFSIEATQSSNSDGERQIQCQATSQLTGNTLVFLFPEDAILQSFNNFYKLLVLVMVLIFLGGVPVIFLLSSRLSRRIRRLAHKTKVLAEGDFSVLSQPVQGNDEIAGLERRFNSMVVRLKGMLENEVRFKGQIEEMKVELLQEQINPHLLYNTLAMIRYQARNAGLTDLAELSDSLIVFYRRFLNEGNFISTIGSELTMIGQYIQVVQKVYAINLTVEYDLPPGIEEYYAVKLFFQPVVENAIIHGIRPIGEGELKISASLHEGKVIFEIYDNGCGIEGEELETLRKCLKGESPREQMRSVGLYNVNQRIRLIYGPQYGLEIDSVPGEGTLVKVTIPLMGEREKQAFMEEHGLNL